MLYTILSRDLTKTDIRGFCKDEGKRAVLNTDNTGLEAYKKRKKRLRKQESLEERINNMEATLERIEKLLTNGNN